MAKHIFVTGGVVSSLGKGINASSIGRLLKCRGLKVFMQKMDPYINVDPGKMSPLQHGEVFVTDDGAETDLDLGHYERFIDERLNKYSCVTTGKIYLRVIQRERNGEYEGKTVQVIPHITGAIKETIYKAAETSNADVVITEIGGTVGDIEGLPFLEAIRQMRREIGFNNTYYIHNTLVPYLGAAGEIKTKPTQHSIKELGSLGISADMIVLRTERAVPENQKEKIAMFCDVDKENIIEARDVKVIYEVPLNLHKQRMDDIICKHFGFEDKTIQLEEWERLITNIKHAKYEVKIALIGKYTSIRDSYISVNESLKHAGYALNANVNIVPVDAEGITRENADSLLREYGGIVVPGGFGERAIEGIINAIEYARVHKKPFLGICLGMQLAVIEFTRHVLGFTDAHSTEFNPSTSIPIIDLGTCKRDLVNPMRLGLYPCNLIEGTLARSIYNESSIEERHRHRFELNMKYASLFEGSDLIFSGVSPSGDIVEIVEDKNHPFFIACQFHPEFLSRPNRAHPIFYSFVKHSMEE